MPGLFDDSGATSGLFGAIANGARANPNALMAMGGASPDFGDRLMAGFQGFTHSSSPLSAIGDLIGGLATGQRTDPEGVQQRTQAATYQAIYQSLKARGLSDAEALASALNPTVLATQFAKPQFTTIGHDQFGNPNYGFVDPVSQKITPAQVPGQQNAGPPPGSAGVTGEQALKGLDQGTADQVRALAEGRMPFPSGMALKTPYWQKMLTYVSSYDPNFDALNYNARNAVRKDFTSGKSAQNITSMNTVMGHLGALDEAGKALNNYSGVRTVLNAPVNAVESAIGDPRIKDFQLKRNAVSDELAKVFRSSGMSDSEIKRWEETISSSNSPEQMKAVINSGLDLMESRLGALGQQYNQGMGTTKHPLELLSPEAQNVYRRLRGIEPTGATAAGRPNTQAAPVGAAPDSAVQYLKANPHFADQFDAKYGPGAAARVMGR